MVNLAYALERLRRRQRVRYWAIALPLLVIALALPLLRPLAHPDPTWVSDDEFVRMETIRQIVANGSFVLDPQRVAERLPVISLDNGDMVAAQEPMLSVIGAGVYQILRLAKIHVDSDAILGAYLLTLILCTIPTAVTATLIYRCGRLMELSRWKRMLIGFGAVGCTGLLAYSTVLSPYPLAAMLATASLACLTQVAMAGPPPNTSFWIVLAGFSAALGAAVHPSVAGLGVLLGLANLVMPWKRRLRLFAVGLFILGTLVPVAGHRILMQRLGQTWTLPVPGPVLEVSPVTRPSAIDDVEGIGSTPSAVENVFWRVVMLGATLLGPFGLVSHTPVMLISAWGAIMLSTRYWPKTTRGFALAAVGGLLIPLAIWGLFPMRGGERMFGPVPVMATCPVLFLWTGFFLRPRPGHTRTVSSSIVAWSAVAVSVGITALGMTHPYPKGGFKTYPPAQLTWEFMARPAPSAAEVPGQSASATRSAAPEK